MARQAITLGRRTGSRKWELVHGPDKAVNEQNEEFRKIILSETNSTWDEIKIWEDFGETRKRKFNLNPKPISTEQSTAPATEKKQRTK